MNQTISKILKFISRNIGFLLINLAVLLILLSFFINSSVNNIGSLKTDLQNTVKEQILTQSGIQKTDLEQANDYCKNNPQDERCKQLSNISSNPEFDKLFENIISAKNYINILIYIAIGSFLIGFLFVYLAIFNLLNTLYKVSVHLTIHNILAAIYFNFIPFIINQIPLTQKFQELTKDVPQEFVQSLIRIISDWIKTPLNKTIRLTIILAIVFFIISIILYFIKKKGLKDKNRAK